MFLVVPLQGAKFPSCGSSNIHIIGEANQIIQCKCDNCGAVFGVDKKTGKISPG